MERISELRRTLRDNTLAAAWVEPVIASGRLTRVTGLVMEAIGLRLAVGSCCEVLLPGDRAVEAEVVGFADDRLFLMPISDLHGVVPGARVVPRDTAPEAMAPDARPHPRRRAADQAKHVPVGHSLLGRVLDSTGYPLDALGPLIFERNVSLHNRPLNPLERAP
ncbi:MAG: flagellum-specific ATP synthase FliI, partial [Burkholderiales bacterium]